MADDGLVDPRLGKRLIAETRLLRAELRIERAILRALAEHKRRALLALRRQSSLVAAPAPPDPFDLAFWDTSVVNEVEPAIRATLEELASGVVEFLELPPEVRAQILGVIDVSAVTAEFVENVKNIGPETAQNVVTQLSIGVSSGESIDELADRLTQSFKIGEDAARRIARTETHHAAENASYQSVSAVANAGFAVTKEWLATRDARTRPDHAAADNQIVWMDQPFSVGGEQLQMPGEGSKKQRINCRCSVIYAVQEDEYYTPPVWTEAEEQLNLKLRDKRVEAANAKDRARKAELRAAEQKKAAERKERAAAKEKAKAAKSKAAVDKGATEPIVVQEATGIFADPKQFPKNSRDIKRK